MGEMLIGNTLISDGTTEEPIKFWIEGQGWTHLDQVPPTLLAAAVRLLLKEKQAAYVLVSELQNDIDQIRKIVGCDE